jgi:hypothetical protein
LKDVPISSFYWAREIGGTDFNVSGTTGMHCKLEWLDTNPDPSGAAVLDQVEYGVISGLSNSDYQQYSMDEPHAYDGAGGTSKSIRVTLGGDFNGTYYVDGAWLGTTDLIPNFDVNPAEYTIIEALDASLISIGQIKTNQIEDGAVTTSKIRNADGTLNGDPFYGITTEQIRDNSITEAKLQANSVGPAQLQDDIGLIPVGMVLIWPLGASSPTNPCPDGFVVFTPLDGRFPLAVNPAAIAIDTSGIDGGVPVTSAADVIGVKTTSGGGKHGHTYSFTTSLSGPSSYGLIQAGVNTGGHEHNYEINAPFRTVWYCQKT